MVKIQILTQCDACDGEAYLPEGEVEDYRGKRYTRFIHCPACQGSGLLEKWVSLQEFAGLLERAVSLEPDYQELASHKPISQYQDSCEAAGI